MTPWSDIVDGFLRAYPLLIVFSSLMEGLLNKSNENIVFGLILLISDGLNQFLKNLVFRPLIGDGKLGILGRGQRPVHSKNSGLFKTGRESRSYGMPSGHAQIAWLFTTYWILKIAREKDRSIVSKMIAEFILLVLAIMVTYSRVYWMKCHTLQQVLMGSSVGIALGIIVHIILRKVFPEQSQECRTVTFNVKKGTTLTGLQ